jgi:hypothetical protein
MPTDAIRPKDLLPDPLITSWAIKYGTGPAFNVDRIAPVVPVARPDFKFATYKADELNDETEDRVAPGDRPSQVRRFKPTFTAGTAIRRALDDFISDEVAKQSPNPIMLEQRRTQKLAFNLQLGIAKRVKAAFDAAGTAASTPSTKWGASSGTTIEKNIDDAREAALPLAGVEMNSIIIPPHVARTMKRSAEIREIRKYTDPSLLLNGDLPTTLFGLNVIIPGALVNTGAAKADESQTIGRVWADDTVYLAYLDPAASDVEAFTPVIQARWQEWGQHLAGYAWRDSHLSVRGRWISVEMYQGEVTPAGSLVYRIPTVL